VNGESHILKKDMHLNGKDIVLINNRVAITSYMRRHVSGHRALTEQLLNDLSSFYRAVALGHGIEFLRHPGAGAEEDVA
jgi:hypothetical protein